MLQNRGVGIRSRIRGKKMHADLVPRQPARKKERVVALS